ncbi:hypothetical protein [Zobellia sp. OII3]|uniref:hypothetical protein n=1 Tax=Zobellia sp. OII3 TaxID=2034520 RepID=UPI000F4E3CEE|nr:hypothetical protein [Zobellia sp. OII3]
MQSVPGRIFFLWTMGNGAMVSELYNRAAFQDLFHLLVVVVQKSRQGIMGYIAAKVTLLDRIGGNDTYLL